MALADMTASRGWVEAQIAQLQSTLNASIALKQNTLVAGSGVTIEGSVISATADLSSVLAEITILQSQMLGKQAALTAGTGITISGNVISATGTQPDVDKAYVDGKVSSLTALINSKQGKLTAGRGIVIEGNLISTADIDLSAYALTQDLDSLRTLVETKQGTLTAGSGITIADGVISATFPSLSAYATSAQLSAAVATLEAAIAQAQPNLTAGPGISIQNGVISCTVTADGGVAQTYVDSEIARLEEAIRGKQAALSAGTGITIVGGVISAEGADLSGYATLTVLNSRLAEIEAAVAAKQSILTAGAGITIENGVISLSGTSGTTKDYVDSQIAELLTKIEGKQAAFSIGSGLKLEGGVLSADPTSLDGLASEEYVDSAVKELSDSVDEKYQSKLVAGTGISLDTNGGISVVPSDFLSDYVTASGLAEQVSELQESIDAMQVKLTAGDNISISSDGTISATMPDLSGYATSKDLSSSLATITAALAGYQKSVSAGSGVTVSPAGVIGLSFDISDYATRASLASEVALLNTAIAAKQATLVAGSGVTITGNVISSSIDVADAVSEYTTTAVSGRGVYSFLASNYTTTAALNTLLAAYVTTANLTTQLSSMASQTYVLTQLSDYSKTTAIQTMISGFKSESEIRSIVTGYGYATQTSLSTLQANLEAYVRSAVSGVQAGMTYKGTVAAVGNLPSTNVSVGDMYWVTGAVSFYISNGTTWDVISLGQIDLTGYVTTSSFMTHTSNSNAEKHVTAEQIAAWTAMTPLATFNTHTANTTVHVTAAERTAWDAKVSAATLSAHTSNNDIHLTLAQKTSILALIEAGGSGSAVLLDDYEMPAGTHGVRSAGIYTGLVAKQDAVYSTFDVAQTCKFSNADALYVVDQNGTVVGVVTSAVTTGGTNIVGNVGNPPLASLDIVLFKRGVLDGRLSAAYGSDSIFDHSSSKTPSGADVGYGLRADGNSVLLKFRRTPADASKFSATRYPLANNKTDNIPWDVVNCDLDTGVVRILLGGDGATGYPTLATLNLRWKGSLGANTTIAVRMAGGNEVAGTKSVDDTPTLGNRAALISSDAVARALQNYAPADAAVVCDTTLSGTSTNPVENRVVKAALDAKLDVLQYDYSIVQHAPQGTLTVSEDFAQNSYSGGTDKIDGLGSTNAILSGAFTASCSFVRDQVSGVFSQQTLEVISATALTALTPNYTPDAASFLVTCARGQSVTIGSVYVRPGTLIIAQDRVRHLLVDELPYVAGTYVWESVNTNDSTDTVVFAYYRPATFPTVDVLVTGNVSGRVTRAPELSADGHLVSSSGVARALAKKADVFDFCAFTSDSITGRLQGQIGGIYGLQASCYPSGLATSKDGLAVIPNSDLTYDSVNRKVSKLSASSVATIQFAVNEVTGGTFAFTITPNGSIAYTGSQTKTTITGLPGIEEATEVYQIGKFNVKIVASQLVDVTHYGIPATWKTTGFSTSNSPVYFNPKTGDAYLWFNGWSANGGTATTITQLRSRVAGFVIRVPYDIESLISPYATHIKDIDLKPVSGSTRFVSSGGVYTHVEEKMNGNEVTLGKAGATGSLRVHGFELMDSKGHIPLARIDLGYDNDEPSVVDVEGIDSFGCCAFWNGKYYATEGSTAFSSSNNSTIEGRTVGYDGHLLGGFLYESTDGKTWTKVEAVSEFAYVNGISTADGCMTICGSDANGPKAIVTFNGTNWYSSTINTNGINITADDRMWRTAFDPVTKKIVAIGAGNSGNPNGSNQKYYVSTNGTNWEARQIQLTGQNGPSYLCSVWRLGDYWFISSQHFSISGAPSILWRSADGLNWTPVLRVTGGAGGDHIFAMSFADGQYVVSTTYTVATYASGIWTSNDGATWSKARVVGSQNHVGCIIDGLVRFAGQWIGIGSEGTGIVISADGREWHEVYMNGTDKIVAMATKKSRAGRAYIVNGGILYVPLAQGNIAYTSDGSDWAILDIGESVINEIFLGPDNSMLFVTMDDEEWTTRVSRVSYSGLFQTVLDRTKDHYTEQINTLLSTLENILDGILTEGVS